MSHVYAFGLAHEFRYNGAGFTAHLQGGPVWNTVEERNKVVSITMADDGGNAYRAKVTLYLLRNWFVGKHVQSIKELTK